MNRKEFLMAGGALAAVVVTRSAGAAEASPPPAAVPNRLLASAPVLQNAAETSVGVAFAVSADAAGWVEYSTSSDLKGARRATAGNGALVTVDDRIACVRLAGLKPATKYYYRVGADRISFKHGYAMKNLGPETDPTVHSFTTLGAEAAGSFCVINDTHEQKPALAAAFAKIAALKPAVVVWNGDASNTTETIDGALDVFLRPHPDFPAYAADTPYMFLNGNHDFRGRFNRSLERVMMFREPAERAPEFASLGRNFVQRLGDIALIGLDTGEDKLDTNPHFAGIFKMKPYRELQARWLARAIETPAVKTAKFKVAFCHIPLYSSDPTANPGDVAPDDSAPQYRHDYAIWQRTCKQLWSPLLEKAGCQLVIAAHQHAYHVDRPNGDHAWTQIVGGGPEDRMKRFTTVIEGRVADGNLVVTVHDVTNGRIAGELTFG